MKFSFSVEISRDADLCWGRGIVNPWINYAAYTHVAAAAAAAAAAGDRVTFGVYGWDGCGFLSFFFLFIFGHQTATYVVVVVVVLFNAEWAPCRDELT